MVRVTVTEGTLEGVINDNEYGSPYYSFKGIPFAEPPIGNLRFKAPKPPKPWSGVRSAKHFGSVCYQVDIIKNGLIYGSEDCLYLNVYTPVLNPDSPLPVMFFIHGGALVQGNGGDDLFGPEFLMRKGVILVTSNYRLEVLGFLSLLTEDIPGNAAMKDQVAALRWVKKNISNFGGDPRNITVFGESAGAACVSFHMISPMTKGLFNRAIVQSSAAPSFWTITHEPRDRALALARKLGCISEDDKEITEFLKSQPVESLIRCKVPITLAEEAIARLNVYFAVVDEKKFGDAERFFYGDLFNKNCNSIHENITEVIIGYNEHDGLMALKSPKYSFDKVVHQANNFMDFLVPKPAVNFCPLTKQVEIRSKIRSQYFDNRHITNSIQDLMRIVKFYSFDMFIYGVMQWVRMCMRDKKKTYVYKFTCKGDRNVFPFLLGANSEFKEIPLTAHADDLPYIFPTKAVNPKVDTNSENFKLIETATTLWSNFAKFGYVWGGGAVLCFYIIFVRLAQKYGIPRVYLGTYVGTESRNRDPTPDKSLGVKWFAYSLDNEQYLDIGNQLVESEYPDKEDLLFWDEIYREYLPQFYVKLT